jgi:hypothetical protein
MDNGGEHGQKGEEPKVTSENETENTETTQKPEQATEVND